LTKKSILGKLKKNLLVMIQITYPSIIFVPWRRIILPQYLNGVNLNLKRAVHWADIPDSVPFFNLPIIGLDTKRKFDRWVIAEQAIEFLVSVEDPVIVFGDKDFLGEVFETLKDGEIAEQFNLKGQINLRALANEKPKNFSRFYLQQNRRGRLKYFLYSRRAYFGKQ
jgi:hypothetical protein